MKQITLKKRIQDIIFKLGTLNGYLQVAPLFSEFEIGDYYISTQSKNKINFVVFEIYLLSPDDLIIICNITITLYPENEASISCAFYDEMRKLIPASFVCEELNFIVEIIQTLLFSEFTYVDTVN